MKRIIIAVPACFLILLSTCTPRVIVVEPPSTTYDNCCISIVKFKDKRLSGHVLVQGSSSATNNILHICHSQEMDIIDSISSTHVVCPFIPFRDEFFVVHWRWMGENGPVRIQNKSTANVYNSCLDYVYWTDIKSLDQTWADSEPRTLYPFQEIYHFFVSDLDKRLGIYYDNDYRPQYDSLWNSDIDKRDPFLPEKPLLLYSRDSIMQYIHEKDSIFEVYLQAINQIFEENSQNTQWNN